MGTLTMTCAWLEWLMSPPNHSPPWPLALPRISTSSKVENISLYAVLRVSRVVGGGGQGLKANSANWQPFPAAVTGVSPAYCLNRSLKLTSFVLKNCVPHSTSLAPGRRLHEVRLGGCQGHKQLWRSTAGTWEGQAWRHAPSHAGQMQAREPQPHQSG